MTFGAGGKASVMTHLAQPNMKVCSLRGILRPQLPAEIANDVVGNDQSQPKPGEFRGHEWREELGQYFWRQTGTVVGYRQDHGLALIEKANPNLRVRLALERLECVLQEIDDHLFETDPPGHDLQSGIDRVA